MIHPIRQAQGVEIMLAGGEHHVVVVLHYGLVQFPRVGHPKIANNLHADRAPKVVFDVFQLRVLEVNLKVVEEEGPVLLQVDDVGVENGLQIQDAPK